MSVHAGLGLDDGRLILVQCLFADGAGRVLVEGLVALQSGLRQFELRLVELDLALGLVELRLVRARIDLEKQVALLDFRAFLEGHLHQVAGDPRDDIDRLDGVRPAGEVHIVGDDPLDGMAHRQDGNFGRSDFTQSSAGNRPLPPQAAGRRELQKPSHSSPRCQQVGSSESVSLA